MTSRTKKPKLDDLERLWESVTCGELWDGSKTLVTVPAGAKLREACCILSEAGILSAPVWDEEASRFLGLFDWRDVGVAVVREAVEKHKMPAQATSGDLVDASRLDPLYSVNASSPLLHALEFFGKGIHRVLLSDSSKTGKDAFYGMVSQSDAMQWVSRHLDTTLSHLKDVKLSEVDLATTTVVKIAADKPILDALQLMIGESVSSVALLSGPNSILGTLSFTDIKYLFQSRRVSALQISCSDFISSVRQQQGLENKGKDKAPYFCADWNTSIAKVIQKLVATRAHRLYIVESQKPCGVVSLSDVLRFLTPATSSHFWHPGFEPAETSKSK